MAFVDMTVRRLSVGIGPRGVNTCPCHVFDWARPWDAAANASKTKRDYYERLKVSPSRSGGQ